MRRGSIAPTGQQDVGERGARVGVATSAHTGGMPPERGPSRLTSFRPSLPQLPTTVLRALSMGAWVVTALSAPAAVVGGIIGVLSWSAMSVGWGALALVAVAVGSALLVAGLEWLVSGAPDDDSLQAFLDSHRDELPTNTVQMPRFSSTHVSNALDLVGLGPLGGRFNPQLGDYPIDESSLTLEETQRFMRQSSHGAQARPEPWPAKKNGWGEILRGYNDGQGYNFFYSHARDRTQSSEVGGIVVLKDMLLGLVDYQWTNPLSSLTGAGEGYAGMLFGLWPATVFAGLEAGWVQVAGVIGARLNAFYNGGREHEVRVRPAGLRLLPQPHVPEDMVETSFSTSNGWASSPTITALMRLRGLYRRDKTYVKKMRCVVPADEALVEKAQQWKMSWRQEARWWTTSQPPPNEDLPVALPSLHAMQLRPHEFVEIISGVRNNHVPMLGALNCMYSGVCYGTIDESRLSIVADPDPEAKGAYRCVFAHMTPRGPRAYWTVPGGLGFDAGNATWVSSCTELWVHDLQSPAFVRLLEGLHSHDHVATIEAIEALLRSGARLAKKTKHVHGSAHNFEVGVRVALQLSDKWWNRRMPQGFAWGLSHQWRAAQAIFAEEKLLSSYSQQETLFGPDGRRAAGVAVLGQLGPRELEADFKPDALRFKLEAHRQLSRADAQKARDYVFAPMLGALGSRVLTSGEGVTQGPLFGAGWCHGARRAAMSTEVSLGELRRISQVDDAQLRALCTRLSDQLATQRLLHRHASLFVGRLRGDIDVPAPALAGKAGLFAQVVNAGQTQWATWRRGVPPAAPSAMRRMDFAVVHEASPTPAPTAQHQTLVADCLQLLGDGLGPLGVRLLAELAVLEEARVTPPAAAQKVSHNVDVPPLHQVLGRIEVVSSADFYDELEGQVRKLDCDWNRLGLPVQPSSAASQPSAQQQRTQHEKRGERLFAVRQAIELAQALLLTEPLLDAAGKQAYLAHFALAQQNLGNLPQSAQAEAAFVAKRQAEASSHVLRRAWDKSLRAVFYDT